MIQCGCRPWNLSLVSVIIITFSNMLLTMILLQSEDCAETNYAAPADDQQQQSQQEQQQQQQQQEQKQQGEQEEGNVIPDWSALAQSQEPVQPCDPRDYQPPIDQSSALLQMDVRLGRWDSRRLYKMFDSVVVGTDYPTLSETYSVSIATQSSVEKLYSLVQVAHYWTGPISVAVFTPGDEDFIIFQQYLTYLRKCYAPIRERVTFSIAIPKVRLVKVQPKIFVEIPDDLDCLKPEATLSRFLQGLSKEQNTWKTRNVYPQNHLRNLARRNCQTDYVFLTDVDIIPSSNLANLLNEFLKNSECDKCAYVIPTYELDTRVRFPQNKTELIRLANKGLARPFHQKVFIHNQYATNFTRWASDVLPNRGVDSDLVKSGKVYVNHEVMNFEFFYEPFYVARDTVPAHDERFMGYGYTRNTQVYEMYLAGYEFLVLSPVFTGHWGLQTKKGRPAWRERQNSMNRKLFDGFKREVSARYNRDPLKMIKNQNQNNN